MALAFARRGSKRLSTAVAATRRPVVVETMESRQLLSVTVSVTNQGAAHDSKGNTTTGWTGFLITLNADSGKVIGAVDMGASASSANGIFGTLLQAWSNVDGQTITSPQSSASTDTNGTVLGTDSHVLTQNLTTVTNPFEDNNEVHPTGAPANTATRLWGTGTYLHGIFGLSGSGAVQNLPLAYVILKNGTTASYALDVAQTVPGGVATGAHVSGTITVGGTTNSGSIAGNVYNDANGNGTKDGSETGLGSVKVFIDANKNGVLDSGENSTTTSSTGAYSFTGLAAGTYRVAEVVPSGFRPTSPSSKFLDVTVGTTAVTGKNFLVSKTILFSGEVFNDNNGNGALDSGETGLSGWTVFLDTNNNGKLDTGEVKTTTGSAGGYQFIIAPPSAATTYHVREVLQSSWRQTLPASNGAQTVTLSAGGVATSKNIGVTQKVLISGTVFNDANGNKIKDSTETGLSGWRVYVDLNNDGKFESTEPSTTTDSSGNWKFGTLKAGTYVIRVAPPTGQTGWTQTTAQPAAFTLANAGTKTGMLFGERKTA
jgi:hypothetical protein